MESFDKLQFQLSQKDKRISMLEEELLDREIQAEEYTKQIEELSTKVTSKRRSPLKTYNENDTMHLMNSDNTFMDNTVTENESGEFIDDDHINATPFKMIGDKENLRKLSLKNKNSKFDAEEVRFTETERLKEELDLVTDALESNELEMQEIIHDRDNFGKQLMETMEELTREKSSHSLEQVKNQGLEEELEQLKQDLIEANNKIVNFERVDQENNELNSRLQSMELNYVEAKDSVKQGNNLFAEVEERKDYCEKIAVRHKEEILKLRSDKYKIQQELKSRQTEVRKMQQVMETKKTADVYADPVYQCLLKSTMKARRLNEEQRKEIRKKNQTIHDITHRNGRFLDMITHDDYIEQNIKLENMVKDKDSKLDELDQEKAKLQCQRNDFEYKYKMMEFYYDGFGESKNKYHEMVNQEVQTEESGSGKRPEQINSHTEDNNDAEPAECKQQ